MSGQMNWSRRRRIFEPWYARLDRDPFGNEKRRADKPKARPAPKPAAEAAGGSAGGGAQLPRDAAQARQRLAAATEALVWCDGTAEPNPGRIGYAAVIIAGSVRVEIFGGGERGTNNQAEMHAAILALNVLPPQCRVTVHADSQYLVYGISRWIGGWRRKGFRRGGVDMPNAGIWRELDALNSTRSIEWRWVRGHSGNRHNERADFLADLGRRGARL